LNPYIRRLAQAIAPVMKQAGFKKKGQSWRFATLETIAVLNLQKSQWGPDYYINLGVLIRALDPHPQPDVFSCPLHIRVESLLPELATARELFDFSNSKYETDQGYLEMAEVVGVYALPLLKQCGSLDGIRDAVQAHPRLGTQAWKAAIDFLGIDQAALFAHNETVPEA
jgi:hypothetical protein